MFGGLSIIGFVEADGAVDDVKNGVMIVEEGLAYYKIYFVHFLQVEVRVSLNHYFASEWVIILKHVLCFYNFVF